MSSPIKREQTWAAFRTTSPDIIPSARIIINELLDRCERLAHVAERFPLVSRYEDRGIRRRPHGRYSIFYRIVGKDIIVIHILHGARDYEGLLFPGE